MMAETTTTTTPPRAPCRVCGRAVGRRRRKGACVACYRKFRECGVELPAAELRPGPQPHRDLWQWLLRRMTAETRARLTFLLLTQHEEHAA